MYIILWEFQAAAGSETAFEQVYGPGGPWAQLFARADGYAGTLIPE
jgi:hypothetical protein